MIHNINVVNFVDQIFIQSSKNGCCNASLAVNLSCDDNESIFLNRSTACSVARHCEDPGLYKKIS